MHEKYILGVDGGGTKTDYLLFTADGQWVDTLSVGSRSHEVLKGGFAAAGEKIRNDLHVIFNRNEINSSDVSAAVFGMAGIDIASQQKCLSFMMQQILRADMVISNDSLLGIKAGCKSGIGICCNNGTGTVVSGINEKGEILQVGGLGSASGDSAGGHFIAVKTFSAVYDYYYRCGSWTIMAERLLDLFGIDDPLCLVDIIGEKFSARRDWDKDIVTILFDSANALDPVAVALVQSMADELAKSVAGCMKNLSFYETPDVVLAGSVWTKTNCPLLLKYFHERIYAYSGKRVELFPLRVIPAVGAVIWALELYQKYPATAEQRDNIMRHTHLHYAYTQAG